MQATLTLGNHSFGSRQFHIQRHITCFTVMGSDPSTQGDGETLQESNTKQNCRYRSA